MSNDTQTLTLTEFLLARIAEDEAAAPLVATAHEWRRSPEDEWREGPLPVNEMSYYRVSATSPDPRVLAECEAKRRIVENCQHARAAADAEPLEMRVQSHDSPTSAYWRGQNWVVRTLAAVYSDHPDFREEWRP